MELSDRVRARRLELDMTQDELAKKMGYSSRVSINKIEMGRPISQKIIVKLAEALNVTPAYLMGWDELPSADEYMLSKSYEVISRITGEPVTQVDRPKASILSSEEKQLIALFRLVPEDEQKTVLKMIRGYLKDEE